MTKMLKQVSNVRRDDLRLPRYSPFTANLLARVPSAAQRFDQMNAGCHLQLDALRRRQVICEADPVSVPP
jgi:hypothetical protein